jgi:hypothetical protein
MSCALYVNQLNSLVSTINNNTINDTNIDHIINSINSILTTQTNIQVMSGEKCTNLPDYDVVLKTLRNLKSTTKNFTYQKMIGEVIYNHSLISKTSGLSRFSKSRKNRSRGSGASRRASRRAINRSRKGKSRRFNRSRRGRN